MVILDTNVLSALMNDPPVLSVTAWLDAQPRNEIWTNSVSVFEIKTGLAIMPVGKRQVALSQVFERILRGIDHRVAAFDEESARLAAKITANRRRQGRIGELRDTMIAGIVLSRNAILATRNVVHFSDIAAPVINPWIA